MGSEGHRRNEGSQGVRPPELPGGRRAELGAARFGSRRTHLQTTPQPRPSPTLSHGHGRARPSPDAGREPATLPSRALPLKL